MKDLIKRLKIDQHLKRVIAMKLYKTAYSELHPHDKVLRVNAKYKEIIYYLRKCEEMEK